MKLEPIAREGASERVVHRLLGMVTAGNLKPGDRLPGERELAESFGVSRPTIREAVRALSVLGVLRTRHGGGIYVSELKASDLLGPLSFFLTLANVDIDHLYQARQLIEGEIAALAAERSERADLSELATLIARQEEVLTEPAQYRLVDTEFHAKLAELSGNPFLARAASSLNVLGLEFRKIASETAEVIAGSVRDHKRILDALQRRAPEEARRAMREHMVHVLTTTKAAGGAERSQ